MIAEWLPNLIAAWGVQLLGVLSPGPGVALILGFATTEGRTAALTACLGIAAGAICLALLTTLGLAATLSEVAWAMALVKIAGAAYLSWLAWKAFGRAVSPAARPISVSAHRVKGRAVLAGYTMQMTNPKAIAYWIAIAALAELHAAPLPVLAIFVAGATFNSFFGHGAWAVALSSRPFLSVYARARHWIDGALGVFFALVAFKLATSRT